MIWGPVPPGPNLEPPLVMRVHVLHVTEAVYRLRDQRPAVLSLHAEEPQLVQVPRLASRRLVTI